MNFTLKVKASWRYLHRYVTDTWNRMDVIMLGTFVVGTVCRITLNVDLARLLFALSLFIFYVRLLHKLTIFKNTGPKVLMIGRMVCFV